MGKLFSIIALSILYFLPSTLFAQGVEICHLTLSSSKSTKAVLNFLDKSKYTYRHRIYKAKGGWFVVTAGVELKEDGEKKLAQLKELGQIPQDAYCADGKAFVSEVSRSQLEKVDVPKDFAEAIKLSDTEEIYSCSVKFDDQFTDIAPFTEECHAYLDGDVADVNIDDKGLMFRLSRVQPDWEFFHIYWNEFPFNYGKDMTGNLGIVEYKQNCFSSGVVEICFKNS